MTAEVKMCSSISQFKTKFYTRVVGINIDGTCHKQEDKTLKNYFQLYENKHEILKYLLQKNDHKALVCFYINIAINDFPQKEEWEPKNRNQIVWNFLKCFSEESAYKATKQVLINENNNKIEMMRQGLFAAHYFIYNNEEKFQQIIYKYDKEKSSLEYYFQKIWENIIKDNLKFKFSKWRRLKTAKNCELDEALLRYGINKYLIAKIKFAVKYFKQVYTMNRITNNANRKSGDKWPEPEISDYQECADLYNSERMLPSSPYEVSSSSEITIETLKEWIEMCIKALYNYTNSEKYITLHQDNINYPTEIKPLGLNLQMIIKQFRSLNARQQKILICHLESYRW